MSPTRDPDEILSWEGFSLGDPNCALALMAACEERGRAVETLGFSPSASETLDVETLREHLGILRDRCASFHSRLALREWAEDHEELKLARRVIERFVEYGLVNADCVAALDEGLRWAAEVRAEITSIPEDLEETSIGEIWDDPGPELPLRAARLTLDLLHEESLEGARVDARVVCDAVALLKSDELLTCFEAATRGLLSDADLADDRGRDETIIDALAIRELAGELYALTGDEDILREIEAVDRTLDQPQYRDALFAVSHEHWETDQERAPSPDHWWGVRTWVEENGPALALRDLRAASTPQAEADRRLQKIIEEAARAYWASQPKRRSMLVLVHAGGAAATEEVVPPFVWKSDDHSWRAALEFGVLSSLTDDTMLELIILDPPDGARRVHLGGSSYELQRDEDVLVARIRFGGLRDGTHVEVLALDVDDVWQVATLSE